MIVTCYSRSQRKRLHHGHFPPRRHPFSLRPLYSNRRPSRLIRRCFYARSEAMVRAGEVSSCSILDRCVVGEGQSLASKHCEVVNLMNLSADSGEDIPLA
jgi:hypothetical protein